MKLCIILYVSFSDYSNCISVMQLLCFLLFYVYIDLLVVQ